MGSRVSNRTRRQDRSVGIYISPGDRNRVMWFGTGAVIPANQNGRIPKRKPQRENDMKHMKRQSKRQGRNEEKG